MRKHEEKALKSRDQRMQALIKAGGAPIGEILAADFGMPGLPGLETEDWPERPVVAIKSMPAVLLSVAARQSMSIRNISIPKLRRGKKSIWRGYTVI